MNILNKIVPFKMRRGLAALGVAGAMAGACKKVEPTQDTKPTKVIEIMVEQYNIEAVYADAMRDTLNKYGEKNIKNIYLIPEEDWTNLTAKGISATRNVALEPTLNLSPKISGKGAFTFKAAEIAKVPQDSLWFIQHGWTIKTR